jgi:proton glutamate symport protein
MPAFVKRITLTHWILIAMLVGVAAGEIYPEQAKQLQVLSTLFLHLIKCVVVPLIFSTLIVGIAGHTADVKVIGRLALKTLIYFEVITCLALVVGLVAVNLARPGEGIHLPASADSGKQFAATHVNATFILEHLAPQSLFDAAARNDVLQVVVFAIFFGLALSGIQAKQKQIVVDFFEAVSQVMFRFTALVMCLAPIGVGAAIAATLAQNGSHVLVLLGKLVLTLYGALAAFILLVLVPVMLVARIPVLKFFRAIREPALLAFSTASSEAALPDALRIMEEFGASRRIVSFVMPAGYSFNLDGSTLYLALTSVFVAQAAGLHLTLAQQVPMMLTLMLTSKGVAGVPRAAMVVLSGTLTTFGLPLEGVALILGVDAFLDMARTCLNLIGNCLAAAVVARWEGELQT